MAEEGTDEVKKRWHRSIEGKWPFDDSFFLEKQPFDQNQERQDDVGKNRAYRAIAWEIRAIEIENIKRMGDRKPHADA